MALLSQAGLLLIQATVNIMDSRAIQRVDIGVYTGTLLWALAESFYYRMHVLLAYQKYGP